MGRTSLAHELTFEREVEATQAISSQRIRATLKNNRTRPELGHHSRDNWLENVLIAHVINPLPQGKVNTVVLAGFGANVLDAHSRCHG